MVLIVQSSCAYWFGLFIAHNLGAINKTLDFYTGFV